MAKKKKKTRKKKSTRVEKFTAAVLSLETYKKIFMFILIFYVFVFKPIILWTKSMSTRSKQKRSFLKIFVALLELILFMFASIAYGYVVLILSGLLLALLIQAIGLLSIPLITILAFAVTYKYFKLVWKIMDKADKQFMEMSVTYKQHKNRKPRRTLK